MLFIPNNTIYDIMLTEDTGRPLFIEKYIIYQVIKNMLKLHGNIRDILIQKPRQSQGFMCHPRSFT